MAAVLRDTDKLGVPFDAELPLVCAKCGIEQGVSRQRTRLVTQAPWRVRVPLIILVLIFGLWAIRTEPSPLAFVGLSIFVIAVGFIARPVVFFSLPLCVRCIRRWSFGLVTERCSTLVYQLWFLGTQLAPTKAHDWGLILFFLWVVLAFVFGWAGEAWTVFVAKRDPERLWLRGLNEWAQHNYANAANTEIPAHSV